MSTVMGRIAKAEIAKLRRQDFPLDATFVIKEFDVPLVQLPDGQWVNWFGGVPRSYDGSALKLGNHWPARSFDEWVAAVAGSMTGS